jgi:hypothetical protein
VTARGEALEFVNAEAVERRQLPEFGAPNVRNVGCCVYRL